MKRKHIARIAAVVISIVLVALLLYQVSIGDIARTIVSIEPAYLVIGFILYLCSYFFRTLRFHILSKNKVSLKELFAIVCIHNMANSILPARTGEVSYVYLSKKLHNVSVGEGVARLMVARVFDLITISVLFIVAVMTLGGLPPVVYTVLWTISGFSLLIVLILFNLVYFRERFMNVARKITGMVGAGQIRVVRYLLRKGDETMQSFDMVRSKRTVGWTAIVSILIWASLYLVSYVLINAIGINLGFWSVVFVSTFAVFTTVLPIQGIGGFGTIEGGWTIGFMAIGISKEIAIASGFGLHIIVIFYFLILGCFGLLTIRKKKLS